MLITPINLPTSVTGLRAAGGDRIVATAAALLVARFGFDELGLQRIEIIAAVSNKASQRVAEKIGAT